jgi:hypothetical protein
VRVKVRKVKVKAKVMSVTITEVLNYTINVH